MLSLAASIQLAMNYHTPSLFFFITKCLYWLSVRQKIDLLQCLKQIASLSHRNL